MSAQSTMAKKVSGTLGVVALKDITLERKSDFKIFLEKNAEKIETHFDFIWLSHRRKGRLVFYLDKQDVLIRSNTRILSIFKSTSYLRCHVVESGSECSLVGVFYVSPLKRAFSNLIFIFASLLPLYYTVIHFTSTRKFDIVETISVVLGALVFVIVAKMVKDVRFSLIDRVHINRLYADLKAIRADL